MKIRARTTGYAGEARRDPLPSRPGGTSAIRDSLDAERAQVLTRYQALKADLEGIIANSEDANADDEHDPEGSTVAFERAQVIALISEAEARLAALDRALERLNAGSYTVCERCRGEIPAERLMARPATTFCVGCVTAPPHPPDRLSS